MRVQLLMQKWFYFRLLTEPIAVAGEGPTAMTEWSVGDISGVWCQVWTQLHSSMAVLKLNPKGWFFPALFISLLPKINMDWWRPGDVTLRNMTALIISEDANMGLSSMFLFCLWKMKK